MNSKPEKFGLLTADFSNTKRDKRTSQDLPALAVEMEIDKKYFEREREREPEVLCNSRDGHHGSTFRLARVLHTETKNDGRLCSHFQAVCQIIRQG